MSSVRILQSHKHFVVLYFEQVIIATSSLKVAEIWKARLLDYISNKQQRN